MFKFFKKFTSPFAKIGSKLGEKLRNLFSRKIDPSSYAELEKLFYEADLGTLLSNELVEDIKTLFKKDPHLSTDEVLSFIRKKILSLLGDVPKSGLFTKKPYVILIVGVNGSGKTTSLAKLAKLHKKEERSVLIAAADTFRAASVEQLEYLAKTVGAELVKSQSMSDPSAVVFDALTSAKARNIDIVLIDTAGRLQTKTDLMNELAKIRRVAQKQIPESPHETLLVLDATLGQNALDQARAFHLATPLTGIILTKLDGSAKGGIAIAIQRELGIPILWVGTGESIEDLQPFDSISFVDALLSLE